MNRILLAVTAGLLGSALATAPVYTTAQADAGAKIYKAQCAACHGAKLNDGRHSPLAGADFLKKWSKYTVYDLFFIASSSMPYKTPGSLKESEYLNALAYILQKNGFKAGRDTLAVKNLEVYIFKK